MTLFFTPSLQPAASRFVLIDRGTMGVQSVSLCLHPMEVGWDAVEGAIEDCEERARQAFRREEHFACSPPGMDLETLASLFLLKLSLCLCTDSAPSSRFLRHGLTRGCDDGASPSRTARCLPARNLFCSF